MDSNEQKPQETVGGENKESTNTNAEKNATVSENETSQSSEKVINSTENQASEVTNPIEEEASLAEEKVDNKISEESLIEEDSDSEESNKEPQEEIDEENAEDAEDSDNQKRHFIPMLDYHAMSIENLVGELQRLVKNEKIQAINKHVGSIRDEFNQKYNEIFEQKKEEFIEGGGNEIDFRYSSIAKRQFNEVYREYREKRDSYYKDLEKTLKLNLENRLAIIEELKALVNVEEDMNTTYTNFKDLQERWRNAGPVPRTSYNDVWRTYHHHVEIFYDFLHLNRELRDLDFKHNLEEKTKLVLRAEELTQEPDLGKAFRELQTLHKIWKEEIGPVAKEQREEIWERFSNATKTLHQRRKDNQLEIEASYEKNLLKKQGLIAEIINVANTVTDNHRGIQKQIKEIESLREAFFKAGRVPQKVNEETWSAFKEAVRGFNRKKNSFYKNLKKDQHENLEKKKALLGLAVALKDSDDFDMATPEMKRIQAEWKKIGHVPRKYSDKIWKEFKDACNHYFDRIHSKRNASQQKEFENLQKKTECLNRLKDFVLTGDSKKDMETVKGFIEEWKGYGHIPYNKRHINSKFNKIIDALFKKLNISRHEAELMKYGDRIKQLANTEDESAIRSERSYIKKKIEESKAEIRQLENNLQFFSNASEDNPLVKDVIKNINKQKDALETWQGKLKNLNILKNNIGKESAKPENHSEEE
ncbi:DUF349 domain-containing protein [Croceivirga thetidis]|uniref:DUF349 domain-containing protein n=1 Tax=Croceivirga thetidis TaxID=2721623 RepID=A0ABX1GTA3_9FLAO|nr:DUF349 domain-containing protein [Croceivirga thetidis]NKI32854.1 DUF349 domain-containing protein [Croceivirga thetidis]